MTKDYGVKALTYRVLVKIEEIEEAYKGDIIIPDTVVDREDMSATRGWIVSLGPQAFNAFGDGALQVKEGDAVIFAKYCGTETEVSGVKLRLLNDEDILMVVPGGFESID